MKKNILLSNEEKIKIIYDSLAEEEIILFTSKKEKINFNKYMIYLNFLESIGKIEVKVLENYIKREHSCILKNK